MKLFTKTCLLVLAVFHSAVHANIYQWKYVDPADPSQGKQQSTTLASGGAGVDAVPGANLNSRNLTMAYLIGADLTNAYLFQTKLINSDLNHANLTNADFSQSTITSANFSDAVIKGANFWSTVGGLTVSQLYSTASYKTGHLERIGLPGYNLSGWNFAGKNLSYADLEGTTLTGADFTGAIVNGAAIDSSNLSTAQLYSTASYQAHDLSWMYLVQTNMNGANFAGQNLSYVTLYEANLFGADFTGANITNSFFGDITSHGFTANQLYSTANYQAHDLTGVSLAGNNLTSWNFAGQNLTNADFGSYSLPGFFSTLTNANFTDAIVRGAGFTDSTSRGFTPTQLYSTASHKAHDLSGIKLNENNLNGWNLAGQDLTNADFTSSSLGATDLTGADTRGAQGLSLIGPAAFNLIQPDGRIAGLYLSDGLKLVVRDYDGNSATDPVKPPISVRIRDHFLMKSGGELEMLLDADAWNSTISFDFGIAVLRGGTLKLSFAPGVNLDTQIGRTFDLFDWTNVSPNGEFTVSSAYIWDLSHLYTTGEVTFLAASGLPGDFNGDHVVDARDYVVGRKSVGTAYSQAAYNVWRSYFGQTASNGAALASANPLSTAVPEPANLVLVICGLLVIIASYRRAPTSSRLV